MKLLKIYLFLSLILFLFINQANAANPLTIEITKGEVEPVRIAISPFFMEAGIKDKINIYQTIIDDMRLSGEIKTIPENEMFSFPTKTSEVFWNDWEKINAEYLLVGRIKSDPVTGYKIEYEFFDIYGKQTLGSEFLLFKKDNQLAVGHLISDFIYQKITGVKGIFSTKIAYVLIEGSRVKNTIYKLQIADYDGRRSQTILKSKWPIISPTWSPDGNRVAYVSFERGQSNIYIQNIRSGQRNLITWFKGLNSSPAWSPDGTKLAIVLSRRTNSDLYLYTFSNKKFIRLTKHRGIDTEPSWSSDSQRILFTSERHNGNPQIFELNLQTKTIRQFTSDGNYSTRGRYAENERSIVYIKKVDKDYRLVKQDLSSGKIIILHNAGFDDESPSVAPNGNRVVFSTKIKGLSLLKIISLSGSIEHTLPFYGGEVINPEWSGYR